MRETIAARFFAFLLPLALLPALAGSASAQALSEKGDTARDLQVLEDQISEDMAALETTEQREAASRRQLGTLDSQIAEREQMLVAYTRRIDTMRAERDSLKSSIDTGEVEVHELQQEYRARARHAYKHGRLHDIALILSAESINQMLIRIGYLRRFSRQRRGQLESIRNNAALLDEQRTRLHHMLVQTEMLRRRVRSEQKQLSDLRAERKYEIDRLRRKKVDITEALQEKQTMAQALSNKVGAIIAEEARRERIGRTVPVATTGGTAGAADFAANRGALPWPAQGTIEFPFGEIVHPEYGTRTPNPGIFIKTESAAGVRAVHGGIVSTTDIMPDLGRYIIIDHGDYHTVYGNFSLLYVGGGDRVEAGQMIGRAGTEAEPKGDGVFFGIFKDGTPVDPELWLAK
jgi:septal ring factor EnvC (AmiA/AmiB activator)